MKLIEELTALEEKATKGPFIASKNAAIDGPAAWTLDAIRRDHMGEVVYRFSWFRTPDDVKFDAALRNAFPALKREREELIGALRESLEKIEAYHRELQGAYCGGVPNQILLPKLRALLSRVTKG